MWSAEVQNSVLFLRRVMQIPAISYLDCGYSYALIKTMSPVKTPALIALFTDFGAEGPYIGQMQAVLSDAGIPVVELLSNAPAFDPLRSGYLLAALSRYMPEGTLFVTVVDPGVGGARRPLILRTPRYWFVGPDNGVLAQVAKEEGSAVQSIDWVPTLLSSSFHGRDLFSPVAVMLCQDEEVAGQALTPSELVGMDSADDLAEIIYIDPFGNAFTGIRAHNLNREAVLSLGGARIPYARTFCEATPDTPFWYRNSCGLVEIAVNRGRADETLGLQIGDRVLS